MTPGGLSMKYNIKLKNKKLFFRRYRLLVFLILLLTFMVACQKRPQATIYIESSIDEKSVVYQIEIENGRYQDALEQYRNMLRQVPENSIQAAGIYNNMGGIYAEYLREQEKAELYLNKAINIHLRENDKVGLAGDYTEMSKIYLYIGGEVEKGLEYLEKAVQIYKELGLENALGLADALMNKGHLYKKEGRYEEALSSLKEAHKIYKIRQEDNVTIYILTGQVYMEMKDYKSAEHQYIAAKNVGKKIEDQDRIADVDFQLGWLYGEMEEDDKSIEYYNYALNYYKSADSYALDQAVTYNNIACTYIKKGDLNTALDFSINACRVIEKEEPVSIRITENKKDYKYNLSRIYKKLSGVTSDKEFDIWYQENVIEK